MTFALPTNRGCSYTIIGAITSQIGLLDYEIVKGSNNKEVFYRFLLRLKGKMSKACIVMDNLSVHKSKIVSNLFDNDF
jgi:hypothetical protein